MLPRILGYGGRWPAATRRAVIAHVWACIATSRVWLGDKTGGRQAYLESLKVMPWRFKSALRYAATFLPRKAFRSLN